MKTVLATCGILALVAGCGDGGGSTMAGKHARNGARQRVATVGSVQRLRSAYGLDGGPIVRRSISIKPGKPKNVSKPASGTQDYYTRLKRGHHWVAVKLVLRCTGRHSYGQGSVAYSLIDARGNRATADNPIITDASAEQLQPGDRVTGAVYVQVKNGTKPTKFRAAEVGGDHYLEWHVS